MIEDLFEFLRFPSISADSRYRSEIDACADWLTNRLGKIGLEARKISTGGEPVVLAKSHCDPAKRTVLIYGHYDVQPVDPLDLWKTPSFEPSIRDEKIFARGATDNKGQIVASVLRQCSRYPLPGSPAGSRRHLTRNLSGDRKDQNTGIGLHLFPDRIPR